MGRAVAQMHAEGPAEIARRIKVAWMGYALNHPVFLNAAERNVALMAVEIAAVLATQDTNVKKAHALTIHVMMIHARLRQTLIFLFYALLENLVFQTRTVQKARGCQNHIALMENADMEDSEVVQTVITVCNGAEISMLKRMKLFLHFLTVRINIGSVRRPLNVPTPNPSVRHYQSAIPRTIASKPGCLKPHVNKENVLLNP